MSERAAPWGVKRRSWTASRTRRRVSSRTGPESLSARETVATDTRAARATSRIVAWRGPSGCRLRGDLVDTPRLGRSLGVNGYTRGAGMSSKRLGVPGCAGDASFVRQVCKVDSAAAQGIDIMKTTTHSFLRIVYLAA